MMRIIYTTVCLLLVCAGSYAMPNIALWQKAGTAYQQKQYDAAADAYNQLVDTDPYNAILYYNLGNTYYRLNKVGLAILNYRKALYIDPSFKDAADNLLLTESRISNRIPTTNDIFFLNWWNRLTIGRNSTMWSVIALLVFFLIIGLNSLKLFKKDIRIVKPQLTGMLIVVLLGFLTLAYISAGKQLNSHMGVVIQNDAPLMNVNDPHTGKAQNLIPEGTTVAIETQRGGWAQVRLPDGRTGWIQESLLNKI
jgi:tetratricopeptide (TPR) repeat protein